MTLHIDREMDAGDRSVSRRMQGAFLFATTAIVLQALRFRRDPAWRQHVRWLLPWAVACFAAIWVLALWRDAPRGLAQKTVIAMIVGWLAAVAAFLRLQVRVTPGLLDEGIRGLDN